MSVGDLIVIKNSKHRSLRLAGQIGLITGFENLVEVRNGKKFYVYAEVGGRHLMFLATDVEVISECG